MVLTKLIISVSLICSMVIGEMLPSEAIIDLKKSYGRTESNVSNNKIIEKFIQVTCNMDSLTVEKNYFYPKGANVDSELNLIGFEYAILKVDLVSTMSKRGYTVLFLLDKSYVIRDEFSFTRYIEYVNSKVFVSEVWIDENWVKKENYSVENQDPSMHPYMTTVDSAYTIPIDKTPQSSSFKRER